MISPQYAYTAWRMAAANLPATLDSWSVHASEPSYTKFRRSELILLGVSSSRNQQSAVSVAVPVVATIPANFVIVLGMLLLCFGEVV